MRHDHITRNNSYSINLMSAVYNCLRPVYIQYYFNLTFKTYN